MIQVFQFKQLLFSLNSRFLTYKSQIQDIEGILDFIKIFPNPSIKKADRLVNMNKVIFLQSVEPQVNKIIQSFLFFLNKRPEPPSKVY